MTVYRFGSFAAAAAEMKLTASAVAKPIHSLERDLDRPLFIRSGKRLLPTRVCEVIIPLTERFDAPCARMRQEIAATDRSVRCLVVGVTPSVESSAVSQVLTRYSAGHGDIQVTIVTESSAALHDILQAGAIDLAVVDGGFDAEGFNSILLDTDYFVAAVANDNPLAQKSIIYLSDLRSERFILRTPARGICLRRICKAPEYSSLYSRYDSISTIKSLWKAITAYPCCRTRPVRVTRRGAFYDKAHRRYEHGAADTYVLPPGISRRRAFGRRAEIVLRGNERIINSINSIKIRWSVCSAEFQPVDKAVDNV